MDANNEKNLFRFINLNNAFDVPMGKGQDNPSTIQ